jgi:hypothetical protein
MDHDDAITLCAAERYLVNGLPEYEIEAFEQHMCSCSDCAERVRMGLEFLVEDLAECEM